MAETSVMLRIESQLQNVSIVGAAVRGISALAGLEPDHCYNVELCTVEAVTNSIDHAYAGQPGHEVRVSVRLTDAEILVDVEDDGEPCPESPEVSSDAEIETFSDLNPVLLSFRGRGLFLIRELMDSVKLHCGERGNVVSMVKHLAPVAEAGKPPGASRGPAG